MGAVLLAVIVQGVLGGLRVTGRFTLSTSPADVAPSTVLAVVHGVFGQVVFGLLAAMAVLTSTTWFNTQAAAESPRRRTDQAPGAGPGGAAGDALALGAWQRHMTHGLLLHIALATIVLIWSVVTGLRAYGFYMGFRVLSRTGLTLALVTVLQVCLGFASLVAIGMRLAPAGPGGHGFDLFHLPAGAVLPPPTTADVLITTAHQAVGAVMLALAVTVALWTRRELATSWRAKGFSPTD